MTLTKRCSHSSALTAALVVCFVGCSSACFIRNCPPGGKRSLESVQDMPMMQRRCLSCGPRGLGQCVGPNICCGLLIGCHMGTVETQACQRENDISTPCELEGKSCMGGGKCMAEGICCTDEKCQLDEKCENIASMETGAKRAYGQRFSPDVFSLLRRYTEGARYRRANN